VTSRDDVEMLVRSFYRYATVDDVLGPIFRRWLELFGETVTELFEGPTADLAIAKAVKMAAALKRLMTDDGAHRLIRLQPPTAG